MNKNTYIGIVVLLLVVVAGFYMYHRARQGQAASATPQSAVAYACTSGTITATYGTKQVTITLSDGRSFTLPQTVSASGIRYESGAGTAQDYLFASKGDNAFFMENGKDTYDNCLANGTPTTQQNGMKTFTDAGKTFQFMYPADLTVSGGGVGYTTDWSNNATATGLVLARVDLPAKDKTNFMGARFSVGTSADATAVKNCLALPPSGSPATKAVATIHGTPFTKYVASDAGAGNLYETTTYRTVRNAQCYSVEYTIHSTNIGNYSPNQGVTAYDKPQVTGILDAMAQSFMFL